RVPLEKFFDLLRLEHLVESVIERAQIRVYLLLQCAGKKAEPLTRLDRGPGQNDARDFLADKRGDRHGDREVGLPSAGRAHAEDEIVALDRLDVPPLVNGLGRERLLPEIALPAA